MSTRELASRLAALSPAQRALFEKTLRKDGAAGAAVPGTAEAPVVPRIPRREPGGPVPLSIDQERLWFIQQLDPSSPVYNIYSAMRFYGPLQPGLLSLALDEVVRRHETLRTAFPSLEGRPVQEIAPDLPVGIPLIDLRGLPDAHREAEAESAAQQVVRTPFQLDRLPLLRLVLIQVGDEDFIQPYAIHHIIVDRTSADLLIGELQAIYHAWLAGRPSPLPPLRVQFADFAVWQRRALDAEGSLDESLRYWLDHLRGAPDRLALPTDRPRPPVLGSRGGRRRLALTRTQSDAFRGLAQREQVTLFIAGLAVFKALLVRLSGEERLIVGTPIDYRKGPDLDPLIGFFLNQLVLYSDLSGNPTFQEVIARVRDVAHAAYEHQDLPFARLVEALKLERDLSRTPLTQVVFLLLPNTGGKGSGGDVQLSSYWVDAQRTQFDINFALLEDRDARLAGFVEYSTDLWDAPTMDRFKEGYRAVLAAALQNPGVRLWDLPLLPEGERQQIVREWNAGPDAAGPPRESLAALFAAQAARTPEAVAVSCEGEELTYAELDRRANALAWRLLEGGVRPGDRVGLSVERGLGLAVGILGILKAGCAYVPLDPSYPEERLAFLTEDSGVRIQVSEPEAAKGLGPFSSPLSQPPPPRGEGPDTAVASPVVIDPSWPAYVIYTSGSTGRPKGVVVTHANVIRLLTSTAHWFQFGPSDVFSLFHSFAFDVSVFEMWGAFLHGARLAVVPYWVSRSPEDFHALLARERVTVLSQTPSAFRQLLPVPGELPDLRWVIFAGEALDPRSLQPWIERYGDDRPRLINMYGITETTVHSTFRRIGKTEIEAGAGSPVGVPIPDLTLHVLDPNGNPQPLAIHGELYVGGAGVALGYLDRPDLTAQRFVPDPFAGEPGARLYRSGDLARWLARGELEYLGRIDHQVKVRGFRIELGEIESVLGTHPAVRDVAVIARTESGETRLTAYVVGEEGVTPPVEDLRAHLRERLPEYMVPAFFVSLDALPLTANGKLDRRALPTPGTSRPELAAVYVAPQSVAEEVLCGIWSQVLGIEEVGTRDNFFALGGDSILSLRVLALAGQRGLSLTLQDLFRHQTVGELAAAAEGRKAPVPRPATSPFSLVSPADLAKLPEGLEDAYPLSELQAGMLYHLARTPEDPPYHNVDSWHVRGRFEEAPFREAVQRVVKRHPTLRTSFALTGYSEPLQLVHREAVLPMVVEDLRHLSAPEQETAIDAVCAREKRRLFDLGEAPQWRFHISLRAADEFQFTLAENHAIIDGWSFHTTLAEIFGIYTQLLDGEDPRPEPPPPITYRDYVVLERQAVASPEAEAYWTRALDGAPFSGLPRWTPLWPAPPVRKPWPRIQSLQVDLPKEVHRGIRTLARQAAVPVKSVLLAAHLDVFGRLNGQEDVMTGVVGNGRIEEPGGDDIRGLFLNTLPLRLDRHGHTWRSLAQAAFRAEEEMLPFRRVPYGTLQRRFGDRPLTEILFNYVHFHVVRDMFRTGRIEVLGMRRSEGSDFRFSAHFSQDLAGSEVALELEYDSATVPAAQVRALAGLYTRVLAAMAADPEAPCLEADLLSEPERHQLLREHNDTGDPEELPFRLLHELAEAQARERPDAAAVALDGEAWTYAELNARANRLARRLIRRGVRPGDRVGFCLERSPAMVAALLGILKAGAAYVPLDPAYPAERLAFMAEDAGLTCLVVHAPTAEVTQALPVADLPRLDLDQESLEQESADDLGLPLPERALAYVLYTSGSTGRPKGVGCPHAGVLNFAESFHRLHPLPPGTVQTLWTSISFDVSAGELFVCLREGGRLEIVPDRLRLDGPGYAAWLAERRVDSGYAAPILLPDLHDRAGDPASGLVLRRLMTGVEPIREPVLVSLGRLLPGLRSLDIYGPTEASIAVTLYPVGGERAPQDVPERDTPLGRPVRGTRIRLLDRNLQLAPPGAIGEVWLAGPGLAWGYLGRPGLTADRYRPDPFGDGGERMYRAGDLGRYLTEGTLEFLGRTDHQLKIRGFRIELGEIETQLAAHPEVRECAVLARETHRGERQLVACVVLRDEEADPTARLQKHLRARLPEYMVPPAFVYLSALSLTPSGKVDRRALAAQAIPTLAPRPYVAPATYLEEALTATARQVLGLPEDRPVGLRDNFFELGGHSLLGTQLAVHLQHDHGIDLPLPLLFEAADFGDLADRLTESTLDAVDQDMLEQLLTEMQDEPSDAGEGAP